MYHNDLTARYGAELKRRGRPLTIGDLNPDAQQTLVQVRAQLQAQREARAR